MEWLPTVSVLIASCAKPLAERLAEPRAVEPSDQVTDPVGELLVEDDTVADSVTVCPKLEGFGLELMTMVVAAGFTTCCKEVEVLASKLASPPYLAVSECVPTDNDETESCAELDETAAVPRVTPASRKVIAPVAVPPKAG